MNEQLFTTKVSSKARDYFFDVKQSQNGSYYLAINETRKAEDGNTKRQCVLIFNNLLTDFAAAFAQSMQKISNLDSTIVWDPRNAKPLEQSTSQNSDNAQAPQEKKRFKELSSAETEHAQMINMRSGKPKNSGLRWSSEDRSKVKHFHSSGESVSAIAQTLHRSIPSITAEMMKQGLLEDTPSPQKPF